MLIDKIVHKALLHIPPEQAHTIGKELMKLFLLAPGRYRTLKSEINLFNIVLDNPLGLAAGFDKNGELVDTVREYGFSFVEVGSVTYHGGSGNPKPRLLRIKESGSLLNRMGLNGDPAEKVAERLKEVHSMYYGVNIAKTHNLAIVGDKAIEDIVQTYELLKEFGMYTCINISCPNTKEGKTFEEPNSLADLLSALHEKGKSRPLLIKLSPTLSDEKLDALLEVAEPNVDGYVCSNTLPSQLVGWINNRYGNGGISGQLLKPYMVSLVSRVRKKTKKPIIGVGGIRNGEDAARALTLGATALQAYTGFIYRGVDFAHCLNKELSNEQASKTIMTPSYA